MYGLVSYMNKFIEITLTPGSHKINEKSVNTQYIILLPVRNKQK